MTQRPQGRRGCRSAATARVTTTSSRRVGNSGAGILFAARPGRRSAATATLRKVGSASTAASWTVGKGGAGIFVRGPALPPLRGYSHVGEGRQRVDGGFVKGRQPSRPALPADRTLPTCEQCIRCQPGRSAATARMTTAFLRRSATAVPASLRKVGNIGAGIFQEGRQRVGSASRSDIVKGWHARRRQLSGRSAAATIATSTEVDNPSWLSAAALRAAPDNGFVTLEADC